MDKRTEIQEKLDAEKADLERMEAARARRPEAFDQFSIDGVKRTISGLRTELAKLDSEVIDQQNEILAKRTEAERLLRLRDSVVAEAQEAAARYEAERVELLQDIEKMQSQLTEKILDLSLSSAN